MCVCGGAVGRWGVGAGKGGDQNNMENLTEQQETNLSAEVHCSEFLREEILRNCIAPHMSKEFCFNQCKNVAKFQKDNFKKLGNRALDLNSGQKRNSTHECMELAWLPKV